MPTPQQSTSPTAIETRVEKRLLDDYYLLTFKASFVEYIVVFLMAMLFWLRTPSVAVPLWVGVAWLLIGLRAGIEGHYVRRVLPNEADKRSIRHWRRIIVALSLLNGVLYGACGVFFFSASDLVLFTFLTIFLVGMAATTVPVLSGMPLGYTLFAGATVLPFVLRLLMEGGDLFVTIGLLSAASCFVGALACRKMHRTLRESICLRFENLGLVEKLRLETQVAEAARREAEDANAAKSKFLAAASHDLRQPVHSQGLFLEVLARTPLTAQQRELLASARAAGEASAEMLNTLLDFSRIEAGVVEPQRQAFRVQPLLNRMEREFAPQADAKRLIYRSRETELVVFSDPALVELILRNLVSNAIRYTDCGGLLVACRRSGRQAVLEVWDTGIGIAPTHQREVFREFHQLGNPERDRRKGLGLGLAIADGLARTLEHTIALASTPQRGSVFRLTLPIASGAAAERDMEETAGVSLARVRVLVIDDDEAVLASMRHLLLEWGCRCDTAESIEEALAQARRQAPDVVVSDYRLRERRTGVEAISALRALLGNALPALLITGDTAPDRLREAQASGVPLLHKPVLPDRLHRSLTLALVKAAQGRPR